MLLYIYKYIDANCTTLNCYAIFILEYNATQLRAHSGLLCPENVALPQ